MDSMLILTIVSLLFSAVFSGVEIAFVTSDRVRVELDIKQGGLIGSILNMFYGNRDFFISTILVGNNVVLVIYGLGAAALLEPWIATWCDNPAGVLIVQTLISTAVILLTGEFFPKTIFRINPNASIKIMALPIAIFYILLYPVSLLSTWISQGLMKLCGIKPENGAFGLLSVGDLNQYIERTIDDNKQQDPVEREVEIFHNALDFSTTHLRDCMIPRNEMVAVDIDDTSRETLSALFTSSGRSKIVVYREDIDNVIGYIHVSELFDPEADWKTRVKPVVFAPETLLANKMMRRLLGEKRSMAVVVDEFGGTAGLVTLEDLVEEIFGDIQDEHDKNKLTAKEIEPGVYLFSGRTEIESIRDTFDLDIPESDDYQTLAGYILTETGTLPQQGETIEIGGMLFTIEKRAATRLELIRVEKKPASSGDESE
ncbi:MAG: hemolysin family protein [Clostridium sp.]|nr:hemolysin family protein [Clostridium sp.]